MSAVSIEILIILALLVANGVFAMAEIAVISARKARLQQRADEGDGRARAALALAQDPDDFLSTVQIGITLIGVLAGAFGGATLSVRLVPFIARVKLLAPYADDLAFAAVVIVITYLSLVIGELAPKRLALNDPERVASLMAGPMRWLARSVAPLVRLLTASTDLLLRLLRVRPTGDPAVTEEEIRVLINQGTQAGVISAVENEVVQNIFRLADRSVGSLMTPRTEIAWLDAGSAWAAAVTAISASGHTRYPICEGDLDHVIGIIEAQRLLICHATGENCDWRTLARPPLFVPESLAAVRMLEMYHDTGQHLALIVDEYGGIQGLITLRDILTGVVGDITQAAHDEPARAVQREDGSWLLDGMLSADEFRSVLGLAELPGEEEGVFETLGGFVMMRLSRIPHVTDQFESYGYRFEIVDMDGRRVDKVLATPLSKASKGAKQ